MGPTAPATAERPSVYDEAQHRAMIRQAAESLLGATAHLHCGPDCAGYHRGWMLLQHLGLISGLFSERPFIVEAIRARAQRGPLRRILIAGSADFGLLSVVHEALGEAIGAVEITVCDRCETPLALCRLYASRRGFALITEQRDLQSAPPSGRFDLVLMHSLLSFCPPAERGHLLARLARCVEPDGTLLAYQSIRPAPEPQPLSYGEAEIESMVNNAVSIHRAAPSSLPWTEPQLARAVRDFCHAKKTMSVPSADAVLADARSQGLRLQHSRLLFDSASSTHRAATPKSDHLKYEFAFAPAGH